MRGSRLNVLLGVLALLLAYYGLTQWLSYQGKAAKSTAASPAMAAPEESKPDLDVPYVPTPEVVVDRMLKMAKVKKTDTVYDLGCGDGRIVITAAKQYGAKGVGVDLDPERIRESNANAKAAGVTDRVKFLQRDLFTMDIRPATVMAMYLLPEVNLKLRPKILDQLRPGARVVSHDYDMDDWKPEETVTVEGPYRTHTLYSWIVPARVAGTWRVSVSGEPARRLRLKQTFQEATGTLNVGGRDLPVKATLKGEQISFTLTRTSGGREVTQKFSGTVSGNSMRGTFTSSDRTGTRKWTARRTAAS